MSNETKESYDSLPYAHVSHAASHPGALAALATMYGLSPPQPVNARVLEIGCGTGGNLIPISLSYPESECVGIDISPHQIGIGQDIIRKLGSPRNIRLLALDLARLDDAFGRFDYIIVHGVFSWVPPELREKILDICKSRLSPAGVAYISYNTYPGWHTKMISRELMRRCSEGLPAHGDKARFARKILDFFSQTAIDAPEFPHATLIRQVNEDIRQKPDFYLYHEYLEEHNRPLYFGDFIKRICQRGLQYVCDAQPHLSCLKIYPRDTQDFIAGIAKDRLAG